MQTWRQNPLERSISGLPDLMLKFRIYTCQKRAQTREHQKTLKTEALFCFSEVYSLHSCLILNFTLYFSVVKYVLLSLEFKIPLTPSSRGRQFPPPPQNRPTKKSVGVVTSPDDVQAQQKWRTKLNRLVHCC